MKNVIVISCLIVFWALNVFAQIPKGVKEIKNKVITGEARWSGTILIRGDVVIAPSGHLQIAPGTRILFAPNQDTQHSGFDKTRAELIVKGTIFSKGTINRKITFTSAATNPRMQDWAGIVILNGKRPAIFEFAVVEYAYNGFDIKKSNPVIQNCQIQFNYNAGVKVAVRSRARLIGNIIRDNGYAGVICETGAQPILTDNLITKNQIGVIAFGSANPNLGNLKKGPNYNPGRNALFDNLDYDVYNHSSNDIMAEGNSWGSKELNTILAHIYDKQDADRFGAVDFNPIMGNVDLLKKMLLAQQPQTPVAKDTVATAPAAESSQPTAQSVAPPPKSVETLMPKTSGQEKVATIDTTRVSNSQTLAASQPARPESKDTTTLAASAPAPAKAESTKTEPKVSKPQIDFNQVFLDVFLDHKVQVVKKAKPIIDDPARGMYEHGRVVVRIVVNRQGAVEQAKILKGLNYYYDQLALDAAKKFKFVPGTVKGVPVRFSTSILFKF